MLLIRPDYFNDVLKCRGRGISCCGSGARDLYGGVTCVETIRARGREGSGVFRRPMQGATNAMQ